MAEQAYSMLKEVHDGAQNWRIKARVARLWEHRDERKGNELIRLHLVLVDEKGDGIHAFVPQGQIPRFRPLLAEGHAYYLQYFEVSPVVRPYRSTVHKAELRFAPWTTVIEVANVDATFPLHYYALRSFKELLDSVTDKTYLADIVGLLTGISPLTSLDARGKPTVKRNLRLTDGRCTAIVALWGDKAREVDADTLFQRSRCEPVIVLAMGCNFRMQDGMLQVSPSFGSKVCYDAANSEVSAFRNRIIGLDHSIELIPDKGRQLVFSEIENVTVSYLAGLIPHEHLNKVYRTKIAIQEVPSAQNWWFRSCDRCSSGATEEGDSFRCSKEGCPCKTASPRYKLGVKAADGDAVVDMVFFGDIATDLIGKPADDLVVEFLDSGVSMPPEISRLVGRRYVVEVTVSRFSLRRERIDFQVLKFFAEGGESYASFSLPGVSSGATDVAKVVTEQASNAEELANSEMAGHLLPVFHVGDAPVSAECVVVKKSVGISGDVPGAADAQAESGVLPVLSTPPAVVLEGGEEISGEKETVAGVKAGSAQKRKRVRSGGAKSSVAKRLYSDERAASPQSDGDE